MHRFFAFLLANAGVQTLYAVSAAHAKTKTRRNEGTYYQAVDQQQGQSQYAYAQPVMDYASQSPQAVDQQQGPDMSLQPNQGESFMATPAYQQPGQNYAQDQLQIGPGFAQEAPMQVARRQQQPQRQQLEQQASFLGMSAQAESSTVMNQLTEAVQKQNQALMALEAEQHHLADLQTDFAERSLDAMEAMAGVPQCKKFSKPGKVSGSASCDDACEKAGKKYTGGEWAETEGSDGLMASISAKPHRCDCKLGDKDDTKKTICTDGALTTSASVLGALGMVLLLLQL